MMRLIFKEALTGWCGRKAKVAKRRPSAKQVLTGQRRDDCRLYVVYRWGEGERFGYILEVELVIY